MVDSEADRLANELKRSLEAEFVEKEMHRRTFEAMNKACAERDSLRLDIVGLKIRITQLSATTARLVSAAKKLTTWFDNTFAQACSNGLFDAWGWPINCKLLNEGAHEARKAIAEARKLTGNRSEDVQS